MERYVTKPLMQKDLVAIVRHYCVRGDAEAITLSFNPPPESTEVSTALQVPTSLTVPSTVGAMVSAGHVAAPIGVSSGLPAPMLLSATPVPTASTTAGEKTVAPKPVPKRELELSPAALRGLALIRETTLQDESSKVGGGGNMKSMNLALPIASSSPMCSSTSALTSMVAPSATGETVHGVAFPPAIPGSHPMQHSNSHYRLTTTHAMTSPSLNSVPIAPLNKASSSPSLSASYQAGLASPPLPTTATATMAVSQGPTPAATTPSSLLSPASPTSSHLPGPIAAMAAAVAVATATVKTVSSAIHDHIPQPSIYAAQGSSVANGSNNLCSPWSSLLSNGASIHQTLQNGQQSQGHVLQSSQDHHQNQMPLMQPQPQLIYPPMQEVFVPYMQSCGITEQQLQQDSISIVSGGGPLFEKPFPVTPITPITPITPVTITVTVPESVSEPLLPPAAVSEVSGTSGIGAESGTGVKLPSVPLQLKTWL
jgi:hypothetical protein